jgi:hypothetical protein
MAHPLPTRIRYLEPVRKQLAALDPDDIHEDTDLSVLRRVVRKRVKGLSEGQARAALQEDAAELERWLATPGLQDARLYFVLPILPEAVEVLLTEQSQEPPERGEVSLELPDGAKIMKENGCWSVKWRRLLLCLAPSHREEMHREAGRFKDEAKSRPIVGGSGMSVADVRFGQVSGIKCITKVASPRFKRLEYALEVPGGYVTAALAQGAGDFDESEIERYFRTLRVLNYPPPPRAEHGNAGYQGAAPNGGPAATLDNSGAAEGPPSVS